MEDEVDPAAPSSGSAPLQLEQLQQHIKQEQLQQPQQHQQAQQQQPEQLPVQQQQPEQLPVQQQPAPPVPGARNYGYSDEFMMYSFKVEPCMRQDKHPRGSCPYAHPGDVARRRHPSCYQALLCPEVRAKKVCPRMDECQCSHSAFEFWLHPDRYRTSMCEKGIRCSRPVCFFAHTQLELRPLPAGLKPAAPHPDEGSSPAASMRHAGSAARGGAAVAVPAPGYAPAGAPAQAAFLAPGAGLLHEPGGSPARYASPAPAMGLQHVARPPPVLHGGAPGGYAPAPLAFAPYVPEHGGGMQPHGFAALAAHRGGAYSAPMPAADQLPGSAPMYAVGPPPYHVVLHPPRPAGGAAAPPPRAAVPAPADVFRQFQQLSVGGAAPPQAPLVPPLPAAAAAPPPPPAYDVSGGLVVVQPGAGMPVPAAAVYLSSPMEATWAQQHGMGSYAAGGGGAHHGAQQYAAGPAPKPAGGEPGPACALPGWQAAPQLVPGTDAGGSMLVGAGGVGLAAHALAGASGVVLAPGAQPAMPPPAPGQPGPPHDAPGW